MKNVKQMTDLASSPRSSSGPPKTLHPWILNSPLMRKGGYEVFEGFLDAEGRALMLSEAVERCSNAEVSDVPVSDEEEVRGGAPARHFRSVPGGPVQEAFYLSPSMLEFLHKLCNVPVAPTGARGTYSYYSQTGDYLAIHRDIETCDLAVITCLYNDTQNNGHGGALCLYPARLFEPLSIVRSTPDQGATIVSLEPGQTIIMFGGIIPHALLPVSAGQTRIVSLLCYGAEIGGE